jgi:hypothetical protein
MVLIVSINHDLSTFKISLLGISEAAENIGFRTLGAPEKNV